MSGIGVGCGVWVAEFGTKRGDIGTEGRGNKKGAWD